MENAKADIVHLNVGGRRFSTSRETLETGIAKGSMLSALVSRDALPTRCDEMGHVFIDRDGDRFTVLLNYLRSASLHVEDGRAACAAAPAGSVALELVLEEAHFFGLDALAGVVQNRLDQLRLRDDLERRVHHDRLRALERHACCAFTARCAHRHGPMLDIDEHADVDADGHGDVDDMGLVDLDGGVQEDGFEPSTGGSGGTCQFTLDAEF